MHTRAAEGARDAVPNSLCIVASYKKQRQASTDAKHGQRENKTRNAGSVPLKTKQTIHSSDQSCFYSFGILRRNAALLNLSSSFFAFASFLHEFTTSIPCRTKEFNVNGFL